MRAILLFDEVETHDAGILGALLQHGRESLRDSLPAGGAAGGNDEIRVEVGVAALRLSYDRFVDSLFAMCSDLTPTGRRSVFGTIVRPVGYLA
ncbi:MAG: hypothetical protein ACRD2N_20325 [Vicinamibacterales bacterium]